MGHEVVPRKPHDHQRIKLFGSFLDSALRFLSARCSKRENHGGWSDATMEEMRRLPNQRLMDQHRLRSPKTLVDEADNTVRNIYHKTKLSLEVDKR